MVNSKLVFLERGCEAEAITAIEAKLKSMEAKRGGATAHATQSKRPTAVDSATRTGVSPKRADSGLGEGGKAPVPKTTASARTKPY